MNRSIISLKGVNKHYGDYHALRSIDLDIRSGEFFSLLGPSGCGKTTLLRTIAGFETLSSGTLEIDGRPMAGVPANRRPTNMVFQSYAIFPHLSVAENVGFGLRRRTDIDKGAKDALIIDVLNMVGLDGYGGRSAYALSGGQRQRVALARALILKPKVLLLDEPLSALDKKMREHMQMELRRLQRQVGITFILVTHDQEEALIMSDRIAVMFEGMIAQLASPQRLYRRPVDRKVAGFIGMMNFLPCKVVDKTSDKVRIEVAGLGRVEVETGQCPSGVPEKDAKVGVRPESLSLLFEGEPGTRDMSEGVIEDRAYYGDMTYYDVVLDGLAHPVTVSMKNLSWRPVLARGDRTRISWDLRSLVVFRD
ncbi:MAG: ABC transporter ATP-binding protein [Pseudomonadota bacterium]